jgi:hypothetical protein
MTKGEWTEEWEIAYGSKVCTCLQIAWKIMFIKYVHVIR